MLISLVLAWASRRRRFAWSPSLELDDSGVYSTLLPGSYL